MIINAEKFRNRKEFQELQALLKHLEERDLPETTKNYISQKVEGLNAFHGSDKETDKKISAVKNDILGYLRKEHDLVPENFYTLLWIPLGMSAFGLPIGVVMFLFTDNAAFIAIGLPLGVGLGSLFGASFDKKAEKEGRVLKFSGKK